MEMHDSFPALSGSDPGRAHWMFWELGAMAALLAVALSPMDSDLQALYGIVCLLFVMGLVTRPQLKTI